MENRDMWPLVLPALRADLRLVECYGYQPAAPFAIRIAAYGGLDDRCAPLDALLRWRHQTTLAFSCRLFDGDHFFVTIERDALLADITLRLKECWEGVCGG